MHPVVTYTLLAGCGIAFVFALWLDGRERARWVRVRPYAFALQVGALAAAYMVLRPGRGEDPRVAMAASAARGRPLMVEVYSNY